MSWNAALQKVSNLTLLHDETQHRAEPGLILWSVSNAFTAWGVIGKVGRPINIAVMQQKNKNNKNKSMEGRSSKYSHHEL
jgi:hypothetical protein